ncbi:MAG: BMP family ABC transporter substrate-binding protein [Clostridia bacterium]|nr:BMP family ABC transporter substrate-binding protein [Clostridia bacterium]
MKNRILAIILVFATLFAFAACTTTGDNNQEYKVAMVTDYGDITDQSFNQATYEGCKDWCDANGISFKYYKPATNSDDDRIASTKEAIAAGYNVIVMPGYAFAPTIEATATLYPDVHFIALDVALGDLLQAHFPDYDFNPDNAAWSSYTLPSNVYCAVYQEEIAGFLAGYAAVKEGFTKLGFLGGMSVPAVVRYGYGFVQGADLAAKEGSVNISINYVYGGQFFGDNDITAVMDTWYSQGTEVVFACGGGIYTSAAEAAKKVNGKVIGVDVDQKPTIDGQYGAGMTVTSAMKGLYATVQTCLNDLIKNGKFESKIDTLGLVSKTDVEKNYVQLPVGTWSMTKFTVDNYKTLVGQIFDKTVAVSADIGAHPAVSEFTTVNYQADIK